MEYQCSSRIKIFNKFIKSVSHLITHEVLTLLHKKYYIKEFNIEQINEAAAKSIYAAIVSRSNKSNGNKTESNWRQNELRMFVWTLLFYSKSSQLEIHNFTEVEWEFFLAIFPNKEKILFQYQAYNLLKSHNQYKKWGEQQDHIFQQLLKKDNYRLKWSDLAKNLYVQSNCKFFRTPKQCRERWLNHLDPSKMKKGWLEEEDFLLIENVKFFGKKWANISKKLQNRRNQHSIKNRFKSLMRKESKLFSESVNEKQLIDSLYSTMIQKSTNHHSEIQLNRQEIHKINQIEQYENYDFESQRPVESIFDHCDHWQFYKEKKNVSIELIQNVPQNRNQQQTAQKHIFEFSKINSPQRKLQNIHLQTQQQNEAEKRVRADLFLQEDPFQMLRSYFYKSSFSQ